jgi:hypothetical protein
MAELGQTEKNSVRADVFRSSPAGSTGRRNTGVKSLCIRRKSEAPIGHGESVDCDSFLVSKDLVSYIFLKSGVLFGYKDGAAYGHPCL